MITVHTKSHSAIFDGGDVEVLCAQRTGITFYLHSGRSYHADRFEDVILEDEPEYKARVTHAWRRVEGIRQTPPPLPPVLPSEQQGRLRAAKTSRGY